MNIDVKDLKPSPHNNRTVFDLDSLSASIKEVGIIEPIVVREVDKGYQIVCGERRWRAAKKAKCETVPCIVRELTDEQAFELTLTENMERDDLSVLEEAAGVQAYLDKGYNAAQVAAALGRSPTWVAQRANITKLSAVWVEAITTTPEEHNEDSYWKPTISAYNNYPVSHLEEIALLPEEVQDKLFKLSHPRDVPTTAGLRADIEKLTRLLKKAPFPLDWKEEGKNGKGVVPDCQTCPMRQGASPDLFGLGHGIDAKDDICQNGYCYKTKVRKWEAKKLSEAKGKARAKDKETANKDLVLHVVDQQYSYYSSDKKGSLQTKGNPNTADIAFFKCKKADEGARQALYNSRLIYVRPEQEDVERAAEAKAEREKRLKADEKEQKELVNQRRVKDVLFDQLVRVAALPGLYPIEEHHMLLCMALISHTRWSDQTLKKMHGDITERGLVNVFWVKLADELNELGDTKELTWAMKQLGYDYKDMLKNIDALEEEQRQLYKKEDEAADAGEMRGEEVEEEEVVTA